MMPAQAIFADALLFLFTGRLAGTGSTEGKTENGLEMGRFAPR
jgi:hypothetical protein